MGITVERSCPKCAYRKEFQEGAGMHARNLSRIRAVFSEKELEAFEKALQEKRVGQYELIQETGYCDTCKELETTVLLKYDVDGTQGKTIQKGCTECGKELLFQGKENICPRCGAVMLKKTIGFWD